MTFYRKVYEAADKDENYDVIYLDFSKAFDKVPLQRLLHKVRAHGIRVKYTNGWKRDSVIECSVHINRFKSDRPARR